MNKLAILAFLAFASLRVEQAFNDSQIVPIVVDVAPQKFVAIHFPSGVIADLGNVLTPTQVKDQPTVIWASEKNALYTLMMVDPDVPSRTDHSQSEFRHWLVVNIPGNNVSDGQTIVEFMSSAPPLGSGLHRYVFLIFEQQAKIISNDPVVTFSAAARFNTSTRAYVADHNLGDPVAGNFYQAMYDDYVPSVLAQLVY